MKKGPEKRVEDTATRLKKFVVAEKMEIADLSRYKTQNFKEPTNLPLEDFKNCDTGFTWRRNKKSGLEDRTRSEASPVEGGNLSSKLALGDSTWFRLRFSVPDMMKNQPVHLRFSVKPTEKSKESPLDGRPSVEALCYRDNSPWKAFDQGHDTLLLTDQAQSGEQFDLLIEVGTTLFWGGLELDEFRLEKAELFTKRKAVEEFYREFKVFNDLRKNLDPGSVNEKKILKGLHEASLSFPFDYETERELIDGAREAREILAPLRDLPSEISNFKLSVVGHAHIDAAWLWPWSETIRKCARTSSSALKLLGEFSEYRFLFSQPALYEFIRHNYPEIFERITEAAAEGKWEPVGGMWVESDVNISGAEPLARQFLYGKRYFRDHFDVDPKIVFLPDAFGFSAALPGIARAADCPYFFTHKLSWNERNRFPHHSFNWEGIDGSRILTHFSPADTYNGMSIGKGVDEVSKSAENYLENDSHDEAAYLIGWGDGGGGPNRDMLEEVRMIEEIEALPDLKFDRLKEFFARLEENRSEFEDWYGELYLERHRGTFTTQGEVKRKNRRLEFNLREADFWSAVAKIRNEDFNYPRDRLEKTWKNYLFNQFHDILPGSSVKEVYADTERDYGQVEKATSELLKKAKNSLLSCTSNSTKYFVSNSLPWRMDRIVSVEPRLSPGDEVEVIDDEGNQSPAQVTPKGKVVFSAKNLPPTGGRTFELSTRNRSVENEVEVTPERMENEKIKIQLDEDGEITSIYDKEEGREVVSSQANQLVAYRDIPTEFEAWELEEDIYENSEPVPSPANSKPLESGPVRGVLKQERDYGDSHLAQKIKIYRDSKRIDFCTEIDWHEDKVLLKTHFPVNVRTNEATYEVQFGHFKRPSHANTSWDEARFEVPHQKWVDVSEYGYGAALLNNGKYGVNVEKSRIGLSLLRAPKWPDPGADMGHHRFTYSFLPHSGDFRKAGVIEESYDLNTPAEATEVKGFVESPPLLKTDDRGVVVESVKLAEESNRTVVIRLYEAWGRKTKASLDFGFSPKNIKTMNLIEDEREELEFDGEKLEYEFDPFEIVTLGVDF